MNLALELYRVIWTSDSNSVAKWRRIMFFDVGMPMAVAMTSALNVGSRITKAPWIPLSFHSNKSGVQTAEHTAINMRVHTSKVVGVFSQVDAPCPADKTLVGPHQRITVNHITLSSPFVDCLPVVFDHTKESNTLHDRCLVSFAGHTQMLLQFTFGQIV